MATVLEVRETKDSEGHYSYCPVYRYKDTTGIEHQDTTTMSVGRQFAVGDTIPIRYLQNHPTESRIDYFGYHWMLPLASAVGAILALAVSAALRWNHHRLTQIAK